MTDNEGLELLAATVSVPDDVVFRSFAEETVVLNLGSGQYHGLNTTAGRMLTGLVELGSVAQVAELVAAEHDMPVAQIQRDLCSLCVALRDRGLIRIENGSSR